MVSAAIKEREHLYAIAALAFTAFLFGLFGFAPQFPMRRVGAREDEL